MPFSPDVERFMHARRERFDAELATVFEDVRPPQLQEATRWYPEAGGKRLRPVMALLACEAAGGRLEDAMPVALAVELVHNFSLVHDDIMDRDDTRRGRPSVHNKWDEPTAILAGDVLFAMAFEMLTRIPDAAAHKQAATDLAAAVRKLCEGQAMDMAFESAAGVSAADYLEMIRGKTALLFEASTRGGALCAPGATRQAVEALARFGHGFGMAFQVADDLLDVMASSAAMGKPWGSDLRAGKRTLLVLLARERADEKGQRILDEVLGKADASEDELRSVVAVFEATGTLEDALAEATRHANHAEEALRSLPASPALDCLLAINAWGLSRSS